MQSEYKPKKYHIKTYGCQANIADSNTISGVLESIGFEHTSDITNTDLLIVNTCSVRQKSEDKVYGLGKLFKGIGRVYSNDTKPFTILAGCMVGSVTGTRQRYAFEDLKNKTPWVDTYINPTQIMEVPNILKENGVLDEWALKKFSVENVETKQTDNKHAFVNISYGCDNFCTFCVVPYARGKEVSRSENDIKQEIKHLMNRGLVEFTLCGQNVNSWGLEMKEKFDVRTGSKKKLPFAQLLRDIHDFEGVEKLSFLSSNPFDFTQDLIDAIQLPKMDDYLHIAVQSGNDEILRKMNRRHSVEDFIELANKLYIAKPSLVLGTDIIVGFPTETREQFMDTANLFEQIPFKIAFISIYSPRKGTPAEKLMKDNVSLTEKKWRHAYLTKVWNKTKNNKFRVNSEH